MSELQKPISGPARSMTVLGPIGADDLGPTLTP